MTSLSMVFTGHMVDLPDRKAPRFPPALEPAIREAIAEEVRKHIETVPLADLCGFASLARGGDILFHETCRAHGLRTIIVLPFAPEQFIETSVAGVPSGRWEERFHALWAATPPRDRYDLGLPKTAEAYARCNAKLLELAQAQGRVHLIALWNGEEGDAAGGTADLVRQAAALGEAPTIINPQDL